MLKNTIILSLLLNVASPVWAGVNSDSLWNVWNDKQQADTNRLKALQTLAWKKYLPAFSDSALICAQMQYDFALSKGLKDQAAAALNIKGGYYRNKGLYDGAEKAFKSAYKVYEEINKLSGMANIMNNLGLVYKSMGKLDMAAEHHRKSLELYEKAKNKKGTGDALSRLGTIYRIQGNISGAISCLTRALKIQEEIDNKLEIASCHNHIGLVYKDIAEYDKAIEHYLKSLAIREELGDQEWVAQSHSNLGTTYWKMGQSDKALEHYNKAMDLDIKRNDLYGMSTILTNIGSIYFENNDHEKALELFQRVIAIGEELKTPQVSDVALNNMGMIYNQQGNYKKAIEYSSKALSSAQKTKDLKVIRDACNALYEDYLALGQYKKALEMHVEYVKLRDSLQSEENQREVLNQEYQYSYEKQTLADSLEFAKKEAVKNIELEKQQANLSRQRIALVSVAGGLLLITLLAFSIYKGKKRSDELLLNILPSEVAEELKAKGSADAKLIDEATVIFTDFKGFTAMSETLSPKELVRDLHECFSAFDLITQKHGLEKIKTIGDSYMAAGGLPTPNTTHATDTINAALEMLQFIEEGKAGKIAAGLPYFEIRIGIHTGPVVAGIVGVKKFQYDIWGDTVNTASRMESSGDVGKVNISETTYALVKDKFQCLHRGKITAKGKGEIDMYFVNA